MIDEAIRLRRLHKLKLLTLSFPPLGAVPRCAPGPVLPQSKLDKLLLPRIIGPLARGGVRRLQKTI